MSFPTSPSRSSYSGYYNKSPGAELAHHFSRTSLDTPPCTLREIAAPSTNEAVKKIADCLNRSPSDLSGNTNVSPHTKQALSKNEESMKRYFEKAENSSKITFEHSLMPAAEKVLKRKREEVTDPVDSNNELMELAKRQPRLTKKETARQISLKQAQLIAVLSLDAATGKPSFEAYDTDHIVNGEISKNDLKGLHVFPTDPDIVIHNSVTSSEGITVISWSHPFSVAASKCSTLFKSKVVSSPPESPDPEKETKNRILTLLREAQPSGFRRPVPTSTLKLYTDEDPSNAMHVESVKEKPSSHLINTAYPIFRLIEKKEWEEASPSTPVPITQSSSVAAGQVSNMIQDAIANYALSSFGKTPIRYKNDETRTYLVEIAPQIARYIPETAFIKEGLFAAVSEERLREFIPPETGTPDTIFNTLGTRKSTRPKSSVAPFSSPYRP